MAFHSIETWVVPQAIADSETTAKVKLGTVIRGEDPTYGIGEFIYLTGVASTAVGSIVTYNANHQTALATLAVTDASPLAVAMSANGAAAYGWYQIGGVATAVKVSGTSFAAGAAIKVSAGVAEAAVSGLFMHGAAAAAAASGQSALLTATIMLDRPCGPGAT